MLFLVSLFVLFNRSLVWLLLSYGVQFFLAAFLVTHNFNDSHHKLSLASLFIIEAMVLISGLMPLTLFGLCTRLLRGYLIVAVVPAHAIWFDLLVAGRAKNLVKTFLQIEYAKTRGDSNTISLAPRRACWIIAIGCIVHAFSNAAIIGSSGIKFVHLNRIFLFYVGEGDNKLATTAES